MIKHVFNSIRYSVRMLFKNIRVVVILTVLYAAMIGATYLFFATREASLGQLMLTFALAVVTVGLLFVIQVIAVTFTDDMEHSKVKTVILGALRDSWKLLIVSLPIIALIGFAVYLLGQIEIIPEQAAPAPVPPRTPSPQSAPLQWQTVAVAALKYLLLCLLLPLTLIHLWIRTKREGMKLAMTNFGVLRDSLLPTSVLTYVAGFLFFAAAPYLLLFTKTPASSPTIDVGLFTLRVVLAVLLSLVGWVVTVGALARQTGGEIGSSADAQESQSRSKETAGQLPVGS